MKKLIYVAAALAALSCGPEKEPSPPPSQPEPTTAGPSTAAPTGPAASAEPSAAASAIPSAAASASPSSGGPSPEQASPADIAALAKVNNAFGLELYTKVSAEKGDIFISPTSISTALAMTYAGARGKTADEMAKTLHFTMEPDRLHRTFGGFLSALAAGGKKGDYELSIANRLWGQRGYGFLPAFVSLLNDRYGAGLGELDFAHDAEGARGAVNKWTSENTAGKVSELLKPGVIKADTKIVLTNAVYFKGTWVSRFKKEDTSDQPFMADGTKKTNVPTMHQTGTFNYAERDGAQALEMPYVGGALSMVILLPGKPTGVGELSKKLSTAEIDAWISALSPIKIEVSVPKLKFERAFELSSTLSSMGMPSAFNAKADFSGMSGQSDLFLSAVVHKAFVDVNEEGTEAAAATGVIATRKNGHSKPHVFKADHPFVFFIRDTASGAILFLGRVTAPKA